MRDLLVGFLWGSVVTLAAVITWAYRSAKRKGRL
jgi:hypothetical protein